MCALNVARGLILEESLQRGERFGGVALLQIMRGVGELLLLRDQRGAQKAEPMIIALHKKKGEGRMTPLSPNSSYYSIMIRALR